MNKKTKKTFVQPEVRKNVGKNTKHLNITERKSCEFNRVKGRKKKGMYCTLTVSTFYSPIGMRHRDHRGRETRIALLNIVQRHEAPQKLFVNGRRDYGLKTATPVCGRNRKDKRGTNKGPCFWKVSIRIC